MRRRHTLAAIVMVVGLVTGSAFAAAPASPDTIGSKERAALQAYLQTAFGNSHIEVRPREHQNDSVEVYFGEKFLGIVYLDDDNGDVSYSFNMAILPEDLKP